MQILLCNDDGIHSAGLASLAAELIKMGDVYVAAPDTERSAASSALTLATPLRARKVDFPVKVKSAWAISGTPADCAKIALANLMEHRPDLVVSGINRGPNLSVDIFYSGTVGAAFEGAFKGIRSFALSLDSFDPDACYETAASWGGRCIRKLIELDADCGRVYNINIPDLGPEKIKGVKITRAGNVDYREKYDHRVDPYGRSYYWIKGSPEIIDKNPECDIVAVRDGYVSITPLKPDLTDFCLFEKLEKSDVFSL
ncbi:MAG: 5'/3'-nucleotidase SurE [Candidatus Riflebacteria bacterium]